MSARPTMVVLETVLKAVPHAHQVEGIDIDSETGIVRFDWRGTRFRVDDSLRCEEIGDGVLIGSDISILMERCLRLTACDMRAGRPVLPA